MTRPSFPLRFEDDVTREALEEVAQQTGVSMNRLAQDAIAAQLRIATHVLEARLQNAVGDLRAYRGRWSEQEIASFARAEVEQQDPVEGHMMAAEGRDPFLSVAALADSVE